MSNHRQKPAVKTAAKLDAAASNPPHQDMPDERYPGTFFRVPGVPMPGKTTWSLAK